MEKSILYRNPIVTSTLALVIVWLGFQLLLYTGGVNDNRCFPIDRAFVFADTTACTLLFFDNGTLLLIPHDRVIGTLLITDKTDLLRIPSDASRLVDVSHPHLKEAFLFEGQIPDRFSRTNLYTKIAELFTVTDTGNEPWCVEPCKACFQESRLKGIIGANLQTLPASRTDGDKFPFREGPGRPDKPAIPQPAFSLQRIGLDHQGGYEAKTEGAQNIPSREIHAFNSLPTRRSKFEGHRCRWTLDTFETGDAVLLAILLWRFVRDRSHRTCFHTLSAFITVLGDRSPQDSEARKDREEGSQGTEVPAPESPPQNPQGKDDDKKEKDEEVDLEER